MRAIFATIAIALLAPATAGAETYGESAAGRPLEVQRAGDPAAPVRVLVVGSIHGNEPAGHAVVRRLRRLAPPAGVQLWLVERANPDGVQAGTRQNARGVDLNRNFPFRWAGGGRPFDTYFPGPRPASEPETRALQSLVADVRPDLTLYYHQHMRLVVLPRGADRAPVRAYARRVGLPARRLPRYHGTAISWQNHRAPGTTAFVVELPAGTLSPGAADRHARAVLAIASGRARAVAAAAPKPAIEWDPIPFGADRKRQMRALLAPALRRRQGEARRPEGDRRALHRVDELRVRLQHVREQRARRRVRRAPRRLRPLRDRARRHDPPARLAALALPPHRRAQPRRHRDRARRRVGRRRDGPAAQLAASLRLTRWLKERFAIETRDVIGHAESLSSPYHHELVAAMRKRTHGDFQPATMRRYRGKL